MSAVDGAHSWIELCLSSGIERRHLRLIFCPIIHHATWANRPNSHHTPEKQQQQQPPSYLWCLLMSNGVWSSYVSLLLLLLLEFRFPILFSGLHHTMLTTKAKVAYIVEANLLDDRWQHGLFRRSGQERLLLVKNQPVVHVNEYYINVMPNYRTNISELWHSPYRVVVKFNMIMINANTE